MERFEILRRIGEGGMAVVYEAIDKKLNVKRALKFPKEGRGQWIPPEARAALRVTHENVCRVYEIHSDGDTDFLSMEYVEGETLATRRLRGPVEGEEAVSIARQLCLGVMAAHAAGVLHLDLKSSNVMLAGKRVVVMDFGLAQAFGDTSRLAGTPRYIAPERYQGAEPTPASDVFSMGVILSEMLADGGQADARWGPILKRCLEADPAKRTATAGELLAAIDRAFVPSNRRRWLAAALVAAAVAGGIYFSPEPPLARLAVLPMSGSTGDKQLDETLAGGLAEVSSRLDSLGAASRRLVLIRPEEASRLKVDTAAKAGGQLGATHVLLSSVEFRGTAVGVHAEVRATGTGDMVRDFDGEFPAGELARISTSLASVVTSAFRLGKALPAQVKPEAYSFYAAGLGLLRRDRVSYDRALALLDTAEEIDKTSPLIMAGRSEAYLQKYQATRDDGCLEKAATAARAAEDLHPDSPEVLLALGRVELEEGKPESAIERYTRAITLEPGRSDLWSQYGFALSRTGKDQEAVTAARKAVELAPGYYRPYQMLGAIHFQKGRYTEAVDALQKVTELAPAMAEGYASFGGTLLTAGREAEAEKALRRSLTLRETRAALSNLGVLLRYQRRDAEAVEVFSRAVKLDGSTAREWLNLATASKVTGRTAEALTQFTQATERARAALRRNPRDSRARAELAYAQAETGDREAGLDNALQAARLDPGNYDVLFCATMAMESLKKRELAVQWLRGATAAQLKDLKRQPDLRDFVNDPRHGIVFQR